MRFWLVAAVACLALTPLPSTAQSAADGDARADAPAQTLSFGTQSRQNRLVFTALFGAQARPEYFGSEDIEVMPQFRPNFGFISFEGLEAGQDGVPTDPNSRRRGFGIGGSFRYIGARDSSDHDELRGLDDVDATLEVGLSAGYGWDNAEVFGALRYGIGGSDGFVGELGANYVLRPNDRWAFRVGPRVVFGSDNYADTYFGVSQSESAASGLSAYDADPGLMRAGIEFTATYRLGERWWLEGGARYDRFQGSAADSPIVEQGSDENTEVRIGVRRAFVLEF